MNQKVLELQKLPHSLRPREILEKHGPKMLSDTELLSVILGSGTKKMGVLSLSREVLRVLEQERYEVDLKSLQTVHGLGKVKAGKLVAAFEFSRRVLHPNNRKISTPSDIFPMVSHYGDRQQEHFLVITLNGAHEIMAIRIVSIGLVNRTMVHAREVFAPALKDRATSIIVAHNHPSGNLDPSGEDIAVTERLKAAGELLGIQLLDHIIFSSRSYVSLLETGGM